MLILAAAACSPAPRANGSATALPIPPMRPMPAPVAVDDAEPAPPRPKDLSLAARVSDPPRLLREIGLLLPPNIAGHIPSAEALLEIALGNQLADVVDLTQPIDLASIGGESSTLFVSFALKGDAEGRGGGRLTVDERRGLSYVRKEDTSGSLVHSGTCAFVPASPAAPTRLVCADKRASFEGTARWLAHASGGTPVDPDLHVTIPGSFLHDKTERTKLAIGTATASKFGDGLVDDFVDEIGLLRADLRLSGATTELTGAVELTRRSSMLGKLLVLGTAPSPPPAAFYRLPIDSLFAFHTTGGTATDLAPLRRGFFDEIADSLAEDGYLPEKVSAIRTHLETIVLTGGPLVGAAGLAGGLDRAERTLDALDAAAGTKAAPAAESRARAALAPWVMLEVDQKPDVVIMSVRGLVKTAEEADRTRKPGSAQASKAKKDPDGEHLDVRLSPLDPALALPGGSLALDVIMTPRTKGKHPTRRGKLFVVPKDAHTWIGYSEDASAIASRLRAAIDTAVDAGTLTRSKDAADLRAESGVFAAMTSMSGLAMLAADRKTADDLSAAAHASRKMSALPGRGAGVLTLLGTTEVGKPETGPATLTLRARAPRGALTDLLTLLMH